MRMMAKVQSTPAFRWLGSKHTAIVVLCTVLGVSTVPSGPFVLGQNPIQPNGGLPGNGKTSDGFPKLPEVANPHPDGVRILADSMRVSEDHKREARINLARHNEMAAETARLLSLANEVKRETSKPLSASVSVLELRKVEQIEKLAHGVRELMRATTNN